jgi:hypothetical protein
MFILFKSALTSRPLFINPRSFVPWWTGTRWAKAKSASMTNTALRFKVRRQNSTKIDGRIGADRAWPKDSFAGRV